MSIIVPTHERPHILERVLLALKEQRIGKDLFEIIVVEDSRIERAKRIVESFKGSLEVHYLLSEKRGPSAARNRGIEVSKGELLLFLDDDVIPSPDLVGAHMRAHQEIFPEEREALLGKVITHPEIPMNAFRSWMEKRGPQFAYSKMLPHSSIKPIFFYTCNLSLKRKLLAKLRFRESLQSYEDTDLALRLSLEGGMRLHYLPEALGYHFAPLTLERVSRKRFEIGKMRPYFVFFHPEAKILVEKNLLLLWILSLPIFIFDPLVSTLSRMFENLPQQYAPFVGPLFLLSSRSAFLKGYFVGKRRLQRISLKG